MTEFTDNIQDLHRVLAAIVFSDAVSFSARMSSDEERTLRLIKRDLQMMSEVCQCCDGRVLKSTGDGLLMYFTSAMQAVSCAIEIQKRLAKTSETLAKEEVLEHRIGIHLGDVFITENDVMGNGVNIAARLQTQAEPGGICLSKTVYDAVKHTLAVKATYLGPREIKNISNAFPVYQILLSASPSKSKISPPKLLPSRQDYRNRQVLLDKVKNYWVKGVLETSLHDRVA
ncbi:adenylate/guanylate cyclase domain-containing protein [Baaleninema sp.]|uniref:adenylate/guanylate cyclase domain-containing protein n=1 Tax=Baaleninema sp. TaxID=3101197 RepID=UPI003D04D6DB